MSCLCCNTVRVYGQYVYHVLNFNTREGEKRNSNGKRVYWPKKKTTAKNLKDENESFCYCYSISFYCDSQWQTEEIAFYRYSLTTRSSSCVLMIQTTVSYIEQKRKPRKEKLSMGARWRIRRLVTYKRYYAR